MSTWNDLVTTALLGTERSPQTPPAPAALDGVLSAIQPLPREEAFLTTAGAYAAWRQAGHKPAQLSTSTPVAEPEDLPPISVESAAHLRQMLAGHFQIVLPEWLRAVADAGRRVPFELLPAMLDRARQDRDLRPLITATGGKRAAWLSTRNPQWSFGVGDSPELWETGTKDQRIAVLRSLRKRDPAEARTKLQSVWKDEPAGTRAAFLAELHTRLSIEDEPFLEELLDDRSKEVRRSAIELLSRLPSSRFVARMTARATPLLQWKPGKRPSLEITLPSEPDPEGVRDGLDPKAFGNQKKLGEKAVLLVLIIASIPPSHWSETFGAEPSDILKAAAKDEFARALVSAWALAATRFHDADWAEAILDSETPPEPEIVSDSPLYLMIPEQARADRLIQEIRRGALVLTDHEQWRRIGFHLDSFDGYWPESLARKVLSAFRRIAERGIPWHLRVHVEHLLLRVPPHLCAEAAQGWPTTNNDGPAISNLLTFRHDALNAIRNS